jgi:hypothetical protein
MSEKVLETPTTPTERFIVRHVGLNRAERRRQLHIARTTPGGSKENLFARKILKATPANHPIRKVIVDNRRAYVFEPHHQAGMLAYHAELAKQAKALDEAGTVTKEQIQEAYIMASRAYVEAIYKRTTGTPTEPTAEETANA